jgi:hypothetical protein
MAQRRFPVTYRNKRVDLDINDDELVLSLEGVARKRRRRGAGDCVYVWTNVELEWEDHHYLEGRWWPNEARVQLTVNGRVLLEESLG